MLPRLSASERLRFEAEIVPHLDVLFRMARSVCCDRDLAADIAQEAFLKALQGFGGLKPGSNSRGWLMRIVHNTCRDHWRAGSRQGVHGWDDEFQVEAESRSATLDWQPQIIRDAFDDDIENALRSLPPRWRAAVLLVDVEGWSYEEAATSLELAPGSLRSALHRARRQLYRQLQQTQPEGSPGKGGSNP